MLTGRGTNSIVRRWSGNRYSHSNQYGGTCDSPRYAPHAVSDCTCGAPPATSTWPTRRATSACPRCSGWPRAAPTRLVAARRCRSGAGVAVEPARLGPAVPQPGRDPVPRRQLRRTRDRGRARGTEVARVVRARHGQRHRPLRRPGRAGPHRALRLRGRGGRRSSARAAATSGPRTPSTSILGYAAMNDGSAREWQRKATQWTPGKNFEGTMPIGPEVVTVDEVDISDVAIRSTLERRGHARGPHRP